MTRRVDICCNRFGPTCVLTARGEARYQTAAVDQCTSEATSTKWHPQASTVAACQTS